MNDQQYPVEWAKIQMYIQMNAGLEPINSNHYNATSIDKRCLGRKERLLKRLEDNKSKLEAWFACQQRHEKIVLQGRRMHRQYTDMITGVKTQIQYLEAWLSEQPPF